MLKMETKDQRDINEYLKKPTLEKAAVCHEHITQSTHINRLQLQLINDDCTSCC